MVDFILTAPEGRVLGCLMEKGMTTPDYYPLSLNALTNACNQKSNRNPVVSYDEDTVLQALDDLKEIQLICQSDAGRVTKFEHLVGSKFNLVTKELAIICLLLLRGPQTLGELRARSERMYSFQDIDEVNETIDNLADMSLLRQMPRQPGQKESRYTHLLSGEPEISSTTITDQQGGDDSSVQSRKDRITALEEEVSSLRNELDELRQELQEFKQQFE